MKYKLNAKTHKSYETFYDVSASKSNIFYNLYDGGFYAGCVNNEHDAERFINEGLLI